MADLPPSFRDDRYAVVRLLGEGGQGSTFEAVDKKNGKLVAIKRFRVRGAKSWKEVELAEREAHVLASISHPALPRYVEHFEENGELFLVTEKIEGESLADLRKAGSGLREADVVRLLREGSAALDYLHGRAPPIVHRDLKPSNVILRPDGSFAFIDFGAVRDRMKPEGGSTVVGTFGYMAPEQFQGRAMPASDVYALAATALVLLTGSEPETLPHVGLAIDVKAALAGRRVSQGLVRALAAMLDPNPDSRPARIGPLLADLGRTGEPRPARETRGSSRTQEAPIPPWVAEVARVGRAWEQGLGDEMSRAQRKWSRRQERREERARRRAERWERRARQGGPWLPWPLRLVLTLALTAAEIAVTLALRVAVPLVLTMLSVVFGKGMRDAAGQVSAGGKVGAQAIRRARALLDGKAEEASGQDASSRRGTRGDEQEARRAGTGGRIAGTGDRIARPGGRIADPDEADQDAAAEAEADATVAEDRRARRGRS